MSTTTPAPIQERRVAAHRLSDLAVADLARSGISPEDAERAGMFSVEDASAIYSEFRQLPSLVIPYYDLNGNLVHFERGGELLPFCRVRYLGDLPRPTGTFTKPRGKPQRYSQPHGSPVLPYFPMISSVDWPKIAANSSVAIGICEGEKKSLAAALYGFPVIGLGGVWNFLQPGPLEGMRYLMPELDAFGWTGRGVVLCHDSDGTVNQSIAAAEGRLALELGLRRGAIVSRIRFPQAGDMKVGLDDYLVAHGPEAFERLAEGAEQMREADALVAELNADNAVVCVSGKTFVAHFGTDDTRGCRKIEFFSRADFELRLANRFTTSPDTGKGTPLAKVWLSHLLRREYVGGVAFAPGGAVPADTLNLWRGFSVEPMPGDWSFFRAHIFEIICAGDSEVFEYVLDWLARLVQMPGEPGQVAIVLRGKKGTGKGKFAHWIGQMMRDHFFQATQTEHVVGKFNGHLLDTVLLFADEAFFAADPRNEKILNGLITEELRVSEQKFLPAISVKNCLHLVMATNSHWAIPATEDERRYLMLDVSDARRQDHAYFAAIDAQMEAAGLNAMLYDLLARDISRFEVRLVPRTAALVEQQTQTVHGRGDVSGWLYEILSAGEIRGEHMDDPVFSLGVSELEIPKATARRYYDDWARRRRRRPIDPGRFGKDMRAVLGTTLTEVRPRRSIVTGQRSEHGRGESYVLSSLDACRDAYRRAMAAPDLWSGDDVCA